MKEKIRSLLYEQCGNYVSGQEISRQLGISRTAVWKHIKSLQQNGYQIESGHRKGYCLVRQQDLMLPEEIRRGMKTNWLGHEIVYMDSVPSTNVWAKNHLTKLKHGTLVLAEEQTQGRGRLGRSWESSKGEGIWMTLVLRPELPMDEGAKMTQMAAAAMHLAVTAVTGLQVQIKWPNDLMVADKKICGILTEMTGELTRLECLLVGIGINVNQEKFSEDLVHTAASLHQLTGFKVERTLLLNSFLSEFEILYEDYIVRHQYERVLEIVRKHSCLLNRRVNVQRGESCLPATALQVAEDGRLEVQFDDGNRELLSGGEVSVRCGKV